MSKAIKFPQDEFPHKNFPVEWWYFNGLLEDEKKNKYAFMSCLFRADVKRAGLPILRKIPLKTVYSSHSLLSDIKNKKFYPRIDLISIVSNDSFKKPLFFVNYTDPLIFDGYFNSVIEETREFKYRVKTETVDLILEAQKKPILEGGKGYLNLHPDITYYYSLPNLKTEGKIVIGKKEIKVKGKSWMDHQWVKAKYSGIKWSWFSLQLENNIEIVCFEHDHGRKKTYLASISYPDNRQKHVEEVKIKHLGLKWESPKTKAEYPLAWRIKIPSLGIDLKTRALVKNQEMLFGIINYWEGPIEVSGTFGDKKTHGSGFMELAGYPSKYKTINFLREGIADNLQKSINLLKKRGQGS